MNNCLIKSIILYIIFIYLLYTFKPQCLYYDYNKTKYKSWDLYLDTNNINDLLNIYIITIIASILCYYIFIF
jgi:hypothetical protein